MLERVWREGTLYTLLGVRPGAATMEKSIVLEPSCSVVSDSLRPHGLNPPGSFVHGILQARILEWGAISFSRESSRLRDQTLISCVSCTDSLPLAQSRKHQQCAIDKALRKWLHQNCRMSNLIFLNSHKHKTRLTKIKLI